MDCHYIIILIITSAGLLGGLANFFMMYENDLAGKEQRIKFFASLLLGLCASLTVPLFLQILSNNLLDNISFKNGLIFAGFCVLASVFSKRFLEDVYAKLNKLNNKFDEVKKETENKIESVSKRTENVIKKVEDLEESGEEIENDLIPTEIKDSISEHKKGLLVDTELERVIQSLFSNKYSFRTINGISKETSVGKERIKEVLDHLVEHGFAERRVGSNGKDLWRILKYPIRIYSAVYKWANGQIDVTHKVKELVSKGIYQGTVDPVTFGISDPAYGKRKNLKIHCRIHGQEKELSFFDGEIFKIE
jgi:hypothetical protein